MCWWAVKKLLTYSSTGPGQFRSVFTPPMFKASEDRSVCWLQSVCSVGWKAPHLHFVLLHQVNEVHIIHMRPMSIEEQKVMLDIIFWQSRHKCFCPVHEEIFVYPSIFWRPWSYNETAGNTIQPFRFQPLVTHYYQWLDINAHGIE